MIRNRTTAIAVSALAALSLAACSSSGGKQTTDSSAGGNA